MYTRAYAVHKRLVEKTGQCFKIPFSKPRKGLQKTTIPLIRPPEDYAIRERHSLTYNRLPTPTSIRLLQLHTEQFENELDFYAPLRCSLVIRDLNNSPVYDTLSYTWNCPVAVYSDASEVSSDNAWASPSFEIICDGKLVSVTANLYAAFLSLRLRASETGRRYCSTLVGVGGSNITEEVSPISCIWIDQICINQLDDEEKSSQVMLMRRIYKRSRLCSVWVGGDDQFSQTVLNTMAKMMNIGAEKFPKVAFLDMLQPGSYQELGIEPIGPSEWIALYAFLSRTWFTRSWVVQEAALPQEVSFCCGLTTFPFEHLYHAVSLLSQGRCLSSMREFAQALQGHSNIYTEDAVAMKAQGPGASLYQPNPDDQPNDWMLGYLFAIRRIVFGFHSSSTTPLQVTWRDDQHGLRKVLRMFQNMKATDPRDKVYAFLGLAEELGQPGTLRPDYGRSPAEVF